MIDSLLSNREFARKPADCLQAAGIDPALICGPQGFGIVTMHRPSNVDHPAVLESLLNVLREISASIPLVFALHPRTKANIERFSLGQLINNKRMIMLPPQGYLEMLGLMSNARIVLTDSGGLQEETTALGVPCLTMRENTERPITVEQGTNTMVGRDVDAIRHHAAEVLAGHGKSGCLPEFWDGHTAKRIAADLAGWLIKRQGQR